MRETLAEYLAYTLRIQDLWRNDMNGCTEYTKATVEIFFEKDHACCQFCPLMTTYTRNQCMRTGELIVDTRGRGAWCPLKIESEVNDGELF